MRDFHKKSSDLRRQHNSDLIRRMRGGDPLNAFDSKASWYPPRPMIEKDKDEMARLYRDAPAAPAKLEEPRRPKNVVQLRTHSHDDRGGGDNPMGEAS